MNFSWTRHRFSGGALALDVANSVILRFDPARRIDRYADPAAIDGFAVAAGLYCGERARFGTPAAVLPENRPRFLTLRETIDAHFRSQIRGQSEPALLADLLDAASAVLRRHTGTVTCLDAATAHSALTLSTIDAPQRLKICPNCAWLFVDRSRNRSRTWCDMAVCGNRAKASRHYHREKGVRADAL